MKIKSDKEVFEHVSKILKLQIEDLEIFDRKLNDVEENITANDLEEANYIVENANLDFQENLNKGLIENLEQLVKDTENIADAFEDLDSKLSKGADA